MAAAHVTSLLYRVLSKYILVDLGCGSAQSSCASGLPCSRICRLNTAATLGKHRPGPGQTRRPGSVCNRLAGIANCKVCGKTRIVPGALGGDAPHRPASPGGMATSGRLWCPGDPGRVCAQGDGPPIPRKRASRVARFANGWKAPSDCDGALRGVDAATTGPAGGSCAGLVEIKRAWHLICLGGRARAERCRLGC